MSKVRYGCYSVSFPREFYDFTGISGLEAARQAALKIHAAYPHVRMVPIDLYDIHIPGVRQFLGTINVEIQVTAHVLNPRGDQAAIDREEQKQ